MQYISREEARKLGLTRFFTGYRCVHGHVSEQYTKGGRCVSCALLKSKGNKNKKSGRYKPEHKAAYYIKNKDRIKERRKSKTAEKYGMTLQEYRDWLEQKKRNSRYVYGRLVDRKEASQRYYKKNREKLIARARVRKRTQREQTPPWADITKIAGFYADAAELTKATGIHHHVDHIVPLNSPFVCGLHCQQNLRVVPAVENLRKGNRFKTDWE